MELLRKPAKKIIISTLVLSSILMVSGCTKVQENVATTQTAVTETVSFISNPDFSDLDLGDIENSPSYQDITKDELALMDVYDFRCFVAKNFGDTFREHYLIKDTTILTEDDYIALRAFTYYEIFGTFTYIDENGEEILLLDTSDGINAMKEVIEEQSADVSLSNASLTEEESTQTFDESKEEFIQRLFEETKADYCETEDDENSYLELLNSLSDSEINQLREKYPKK